MVVNISERLCKFACYTHHVHPPRSCVRHAAFISYCYIHHAAPKLITGMLSSPSQSRRRHCSRNSRSRSPTRPSGSDNDRSDEDSSEHEATSDTDVIDESYLPEITASTIWNGYTILEPSHVQDFAHDLGLVLTASEDLSMTIHAYLVEENDLSSRQSIHHAAQRIANVLTPRHQVVSQSLREFERRATICPLCMKSCKDDAYDHQESKHHLLQVRQHHEQRGWVKAVPILTAALPRPIRRNRAR